MDRAFSNIREKEKHQNIPEDAKGNSTHAHADAVFAYCFTG